MTKPRAAALLLLAVSCNAHDDRDAAGSRSNRAALELAAPRLGTVATTPVVDVTFGPHRGAFALKFQEGSATMLERGGVVVCEGHRLLRLTPDGRPDPSFGDGGAVALGDVDVCRGILRTDRDEVYVSLGHDSLLAPARIMKVSARGELVELVPSREVKTVTADADGRLFALRTTPEHALFLDPLAPRSAEPVRLETDPEDAIFHVVFDDRRLLVWSSYFFGDARPDFKLMRLTPTGARDHTFAADGILRLPAACRNIQGVLVLRDRRLLVTSEGCVALLDADGHLEGRFGHGGLLEGLPFIPDGVAELADGRIVMAAHSRLTAHLVTLEPHGGKIEADTVLFEGPVVSSGISGVDGHGRVLVEIAVHHYVTQTTTDQELVMVMAHP